MHAVENCCPTCVLEWQNLCVIHMRVTITYTKCFKLKCSASIYTTQTVKVLELTCTNMLREACVFAEMHLTHITTERGLHSSSCRSASLCHFTAHTRFLPPFKLHHFV